MHQPDAENTAAGFFDFVSARKPVYAGSRSIAKTGILYSWESELFSWFSPALEKGYAEYRENISRQAASALVKAGVPRRILWRSSGRECWTAFPSTMCWWYRNMPILKRTPGRSRSAPSPSGAAVWW